MVASSLCPSSVILVRILQSAISLMHAHLFNCYQIFCASSFNDADQIQRNLSMLMIKHKETQVFSRYFDPFISNAFQICGP